MMHLVNTLQLEVTCGSEDSAFGLQHHLAPKVQQQVSDAIEKAAAALSDPEDMVIIDRIEIDLGTIDMNITEDALAFIIEQEVIRQVQPYLKTGDSEGPKVPEQNTKELFRQFMLTGSLPWWAQNIQPDISKVFIELAEKNRGWLTAFLYEHRASAIFWQRIAYQLKTEAKRTLADIVPEIKQADELVSALISSLRHKPYTGGTVDPHLQPAGGKETAHDLSSGASSPIIISEENKWNILLAGAPMLYRSASTPELQRALYNIFKRNERIPGVIALLREAEAWKIETTAGTGTKTTTGDASTGADNDQHSEAEKEYTAATSEPIAGEDEKYFVEHSGIIILSPFLKIFFNGLKFLEEGQWKSPDHCFKAVHLLKYMATGITEIAEYALTFEKILCGLQPGIPVPLDAGLEAHEIKEADTLLIDVIGHWKALKNTSVNGLRETFLKRDGIITLKDDGWHLKTERKTADVLLDMMPWGFSVIRFPWIPLPVFTEW